MEETWRMMDYKDTAEEIAEAARILESAGITPYKTRNGRKEAESMEDYINEQDEEPAFDPNDEEADVYEVFGE